MLLLRRAGLHSGDPFERRLHGSTHQWIFLGADSCRSAPSSIRSRCVVQVEWRVSLVAPDMDLVWKMTGSPRCPHTLQRPFWKDLIREAPGRFKYCTGETDSLLARTASARRQVCISGLGRLYVGQLHYPIIGFACSDSQSGRDCARNDILWAAYEIRAQLVGPSGRALRVRTIWMTEYLSGATKFITLIPD
jgi:hypothetical protein